MNMLAIFRSLGIAMFALSLSLDVQAADLPGMKGSVLLVLHPTRSKALNVENSGAVAVPGGTLQVFSKNRNAVSIHNAGEINVDAVALAGGVQMEGGAKADARQNVRLTAGFDPLADIPEIKTEGLAFNGTIATGSNEEIALQPGVYDGIFLTGEANVLLAPGIYVIQHEFAMNSQAKIRGNGVTIVNLGEFHIEASSGIQISAPTEGPTQNIAFWQPRANNRAMLLSASTETSVQGAVYVPAGAVELRNSAKLNCTNLVADSVRVSNSAQLLVK